MAIASAAERASCCAISRRPGVASILLLTNSTTSGRRISRAQAPML